MSALVQLRTFGVDLRKQKDRLTAVSMKFISV